MNKSVHLAALLVALPVSLAAAADLPSKKEPVAAPVVAPMWTGFYAGLNAGYGWGTNGNPNTSLLSAGNWVVNTRLARDRFSEGNSIIGGVLGANSASMTQSGFIGGGQVGYNFQFRENYLVGFETDFQGTTFSGNSTGYNLIRGSSTYGTASAGTFALQNGTLSSVTSAGLNFLGTARARVGYLVKPNVLIYGTGGLAYGGAWATVSMNGASTTTPYAYAVGDPTAPYPSVMQPYLGGGRSNSLLVGYSAGGGVEWMFSPNWSFKSEALYYNLGNMNVSTNAFAGPAYGQVLAPLPFDQAQAYSSGNVISGRTSVNFQGVIARAGVNYHFNLGSMPVVAKF